MSIVKIWYSYLQNRQRNGISLHPPPSPEAGVLVIKLSQLRPLIYAKRANPKVFHTALWNQMLVSRVCTLAYRGLRVHDSRYRPNQTIDSYNLAGLA